MLAGMQWNVYANGSSQIPSPHSSTDHYVLCVNVAMLGTNPRDTAAILANCRHQRILINLRATVTSTFCKSLSDINGVSIAIRRYMYAAKYIIGINQRDPVPDFVGR